ncbi:MAG TPA: hypothetical protein VM187_13200, partial [Niastella sp.]|nr:hypothetical protein [Niastella sp.]
MFFTKEYRSPQSRKLDAADAHIFKYTLTLRGSNIANRTLGADSCYHHLASTTPAKQVRSVEPLCSGNNKALVVQYNIAVKQIVLLNTSVTN